MSKFDQIQEYYLQKAYELIQRHETRLCRDCKEKVDYETEQKRFESEMEELERCYEEERRRYEREEYSKTNF